MFRINLVGLTLVVCLSLYQMSTSIVSYIDRASFPIVTLCCAFFVSVWSTLCAYWEDNYSSNQGRRTNSKDFLDRDKHRLDGQVVVITGTTSGIGKETARDLVLRGATVVMGNRNIEKSLEFIDELRNQEGSNVIPEGRLLVRRLDLADLDCVRNFARVVKQEFEVIDMLINNAGVAHMNSRTPKITKDGFELTFQTNHLSHFLLTHLLIDNLLASPNGPKVINVSSSGHHNVSLDWEDLNGFKDFRGFKAYCQSKLCNILFTKQLNEVYRGLLNTYAVHPGLVITNIGRNDSFIELALTYAPKWTMPYMVEPREGAFTTIYCAVSERAKKESGLYYMDCRVRDTSKNAKDLDSAERLWKVSCEMLGINWTK